MSREPDGKGLKSAYEAALERLEGQGIERPREEALTDETRHRMADVRNRAQARLAELEIMHRQRLQKAGPGGRAEELEDYQRERRRIEGERDRKLEQLRGES